MGDYIDTENSRGFDENNISFKDIMMRLLLSINTYACCEMKGGYWQEKVTPVGGSVITSKEYIPDTRERYSNSIYHLKSLLKPYFDKEMKEIDNIFVQALKEKLGKDNFQQYNYFLSRQLFEDLSLFLHRKGYLNKGESIEGD